MTNEKYMNMIRNNPYVIDRIENPSEEMQLLAVQMNGPDYREHTGNDEEGEGPEDESLSGHHHAFQGCPLRL